MRLVIVLTLAALLTAGFAGCIETPDGLTGAGANSPNEGVDPSTTSAEDRARALESSAAAPQDGDMTAEESVDEDEGVTPGFPPYAVTRTHTIQGRLTLDALPAILATRNGAVTVTGGDEGAWSLVATLEGRGVTPQDARANLERLTFTWSHVTPRGHVLVAEVIEEDAVGEVVPGVNVGGPSGARADLALVVPQSLLLDLAARSTNGRVTLEDVAGTALFADTTNAAIDVRNVRADVLAVDSTNGAVTLTDVTAARVDADTTNGAVTLTDVTAAHVNADTTNGAITASVTPSASGRYRFDTTNGAIDVRVPESARYGYDATLDTTNGQATVTLEDGTTTREDDDEVRFRTTGYASRSVRVDVELDSTNGSVSLGPQ